ncbi:MAG: XdhC family protein [SAR324 cluster bacterium]|nr:XdhC family protein [SAR324 cluster bacterium]
MKDIWEDVIKWSEEKQSFVIARVINTWRSAPRKAGAAMLIDPDMKVVGSVSGGCIEGAVIEEALEIMETGETKYLNYGIDDDTAWSVGLACGGKIQLFLEKHWAVSKDAESRNIWHHLQQALQEKKSVVMLTSIDGSNAAPMLVYEDGKTEGAWQNFDETLKSLSLNALKSQKNHTKRWEEEKVFFHTFPAPDQLIIIGAGHISIALVQLAHQMNFETFVIDPRKIFATEERFPVVPTKIISEWPQDALNNWNFHENTYAVFLTHDPKIDDPGMHIVLKAAVRYIGALGSRKTHAKRVLRLQESGFSDLEISRIKAPIGLDIGAESPDEIALSIIAEIVQEKHSITDESSE